MTAINHIEGVLRLRSPLHCASPDESLATKPVETPTVQMRIVTSNGTSTIPYFPGNDLRGRLRRKAAKVVLDHICASGQVSPQLYAGLCAGASSGQPDTSALSVEEALRGGRNVYMGLFGGGARLLRSRYSCQDLVPILRETVDIGMVPERFVETDGQNFLPMRKTADGDRPLEGWALVQSRQVIRVDDVMRVIRPEELHQYVADVVNSVGAIQSQTITQRASRKGEKAKAQTGEIKAGDIQKKTDIGNMPSFQAIAAGTPMYFRLDFFDEATDAQIGLMLMALQGLVVEQRLGGWCRAGMGQFSVDLSLTRNGERLPVFDEARASTVATLSSAVGNYIKAARDDVATLTADSLTEFFEPVGAEA